MDLAPKPQEEGKRENHLNSAGSEATIPNHEFVTENVGDMENMNLVCLAVSHLWILDHPFFQNFRRISHSSCKSQLKVILSMNSLLTSCSLSFICFFLSSLPLQIQAVVEMQKSLDFLPAFAWQYENSYCKIIVLKDAMYSGYTEGVWQLHCAPCLYAQRHC